MEGERLKSSESFWPGEKEARRLAGEVGVGGGEFSLLAMILTITVNKVDEVGVGDLVESKLTVIWKRLQSESQSTSRLSSYNPTSYTPANPTLASNVHVHNVRSTLASSGCE